MKRILALALSLLFIVSVCPGCANAPTAGKINANIRLTSSDAADAAAWLDKRLDTVPDKLVIGTETDGYGVDVSALEDDGYIIRSLGGETALFARTADGLFGAVRKYAKAVEAGESAVDAVFHEGCRIEKLLLAGNDVSAYAIKVESENDYVRNWVTSSVAGTFSELIGIACGYAPKVGGEAEHYIVLRHVERDGWKDSSYNYHFENGDLVIEFTGIYGAKNGALLFLQNECGWTDLILGYDVLEEADLIDVPADIDVTVHPLLSGGLCQCIRNAHSTLRRINSSLAEYSYKIPSAHHALGSEWASYWGVKNTGHFVCLTDDYVFEDTVDDITNHIASRLAAGEKLGDGMAHIDLGMEDGDASAGRTFCKCKNCQKVFVDEGGAWSGLMIRFANRVEQAVDEAGYDGIKYSVFAYAGSNMPPRKTAPNDDLYITLVMHDACDVHFIDGSQCVENVGGEYMSRWNRDYTGGDTVVNNEDWASWIDGWNDLGTHLYIRVATLSHVLTPFMTMYTQYENMKYFAEKGVMAIYNESYSADGLDFNHLVGELYQILHYYPDLTRAEYYEEYDRLLEKYYGDGWKDVRAFADLLREAELAENCASGWGSGLYHFNFRIITERLDEMLGLLDRASENANSALQYTFCKRAKCIAIYLGCKTTVAVCGTQGEEFAEACKRWDEMISLLASTGLYVMDASETGYAQGAREGFVLHLPLNIINVWPLNVSLERTLEEEIGVVTDETGSLY